MTYFMHSQGKKRGLSVVEVAFGVSIAALVVTFMTHAIIRFASAGTENLTRAQAVFIAEEGVELMRYLRDDSWANIQSLTNGTPYYLTISTTTIATSTTLSLIDGVFTRRIVSYPAYRATSGNDLVASTSAVAKSVDTDTKLITVTVSWGASSSTVSLSTYLTNL